MPDWLSDAPPPYGIIRRDLDDAEDIEHAAEIAWLESRLRCFLDQPQCEVAGASKPTRYRLPTFWWTVAIATAIKQKCGFSLEAFSSPQTWGLVQQILGKDIAPDFVAEGPTNHI